MAKKLLVKKLLNLKKFLKRIKKMNITIEEAIQLRLKISMEYCEKQGWPLDPTQLTIDQILEIRELKEWQNVTK